MNKNTSIVQSFLEVNGKLEKIISNINTAKNALVSNDIRKYEDYITKAVLSSEKNTLRLRELANYSFKINNFSIASQRLSDKISNDAHNIEIKKQDCFYQIKMPETMPHYGNISKCILTAPLNNSLKNYYKTNKIKKFNSAIIVFVNHINQDIKSTSIRDNDNYDYKQIINTLAYWFLPDDSYKCCNMFSTTKLDTTSYSEIFIVPTDYFGKFYNENLANII